MLREEVSFENSHTKSLLKMVHGSSMHEFESVFSHSLLSSLSLSKGLIYLLILIDCLRSLSRLILTGVDSLPTISSFFLIHKFKFFNQFIDILLCLILGSRFLQFFDQGVELDVLL